MIELVGLTEVRAQQWLPQGAVLVDYAQLKSDGKPYLIDAAYDIGGKRYHYYWELDRGLEIESVTLQKSEGTVPGLSTGPQKETV